MDKENIVSEHNITERALGVGKCVTKYAMAPLGMVRFGKNVVTAAIRSGNDFIGLFTRPYTLADDLSSLDILHKDEESKIIIDLTENVADYETVQLGVVSVCERAIELLKTELDADNEMQLDKLLSALALVDVERVRAMTQLSEPDFTLLLTRLEPYYQNQMEARTGNAPV